MQRSIKTNYIFNTLYQILSLLVPLITAPYTARIFGSEGVGEISYVTSIAAYFVLFGSLGTATYAKREIALHRDDKRQTSIIFWEIELLLIMMTSLCLLGWGIVVATTKGNTLLFLVQSLQILTVAVNSTWFFGGQEEFKLLSVRNSFIKVAQIVFLFTCIKDRSDLLLYVLIMNGFDLIGYISLFPTLKKYIQRVPWKEIHPFRHMRHVFEYFLPTIASSVYQYLDKVMLGAMGNDLSQNGFYEQTTRIVNLLLGVILSLDTIMEARMSYLFAKGRDDEIISRLRTSVDFSLGVSIPCFFGLWGVSSILIPWFLGNDFLPVAPLLSVYATTLISTGMCCCLGGQCLIPTGQRNRSTKVLILVAGVNLVLNALLIPRMHAMGATLATVISEAVCLLFYMRLSKEYVKWTTVLSLSYKKLIMGAIMVVVVLFIGRKLPASFLTLVIQIAIGGVIYVGGCLLLKDSFALSILTFLKSKFKK